MALRLQIDPGGEPYLQYAKNKLRQMQEYMRASKIGVFTKRIVADNGVMITLNSSFSGKETLDKIRIEAGGSPAHAVLLGLKLTLWDARGNKVFTFGSVARDPDATTGFAYADALDLVGISGNGRYVFVLARNDDPDTGYVKNFKLYVFKDRALSQWVEWTPPAATAQVPPPITTGVLSYDGTKAVIPAWTTTALDTTCLIFEAAADPQIRAFNIADSYGAYFSTLNLIGTPNLSKWGWLTTGLNGGSPGGADAVVNVVTADDVVTPVAYAGTVGIDAAFSQNGTLVVGYYKFTGGPYATTAVNVGGSEFVVSDVTTWVDFAPWAMSADASVVMTSEFNMSNSFVLRAGVGVQRVNGVPVGVSLDGSAYATLQGSNIVVTRAEGALNIPAAEFTASGQLPLFLGSKLTDYTGQSVAFLCDASLVRQAGVQNSNSSQVSYKFVPAADPAPASYVAGGTAKLTGFTGGQYDNIYYKMPPL